MDKWPVAMVPFIRSVTHMLEVAQKDIEVFGKDAAYELHVMRSESLIARHQDKQVDSREEAVAISSMACAAQFVNLLFLTGEVTNDAKH